MSKNLSVFQGKGLTPSQARVSATMEALETYHAENLDVETKLDTLASQFKSLPYDPSDLPLYHAPRISSSILLGNKSANETQAAFRNQNVLLRWVEATCLVTGSETWVPRDLVELDFRVSTRLTQPVFQATSNGLASGNTFSEAILHGLCEVVERDAARLGINRWARPEYHISLDSIEDDTIQRIVALINSVGMRVCLVNLTGRINVPVIEAFVFGPGEPTYNGLGCHPSRRTAVIRAITEAVQCRLAHISGGRDDLKPLTYIRSGVPGPVTNCRQRIEGTCWSSLPSFRFNSFMRAVLNISAQIYGTTGSQPMVVDLSKPEFNLPVVFVVAPRLRLRSSGDRR
jgi:ribosomal protein S12 methylthiotransferase accessory factor